MVEYFKSLCKSMGKLTIYCCYHENSQKVDDDPLTTWFYGPDGLLNPYLSEFSMFYDIWKNDKDSDYIGTSHYRRRIYSGDFDKKLVNKNSCQVFEVVKSNKFSVPCGIQKWSSEKRWQCEFLWLDYLKYCDDKYGNNNLFLQTDKRVGSKEYVFIDRSSCILIREHFMEMCDYIFGFLEYIDKKYKLEYNSQNYEKRIAENYEFKLHGRLPYGLKYRQKDIKRLLAYLFEWMVSIYIQTYIESYYLINPQNLCYAYPWTGKKIQHLRRNTYGKVYNFLFST